MQVHSYMDPVTIAITACHQGEKAANRIYHMIAEEQQHRVQLDDNTVVLLNDEQIGEFVARFSSEVEPEYWVSKQWK